MAVSKIAVIALVAILAVPILLGYALNLTETTETDYKATGESVNVTPLLQNGTAYSEVNADIYRMNTTFEAYDYQIMPRYSTISAKTSLPMYYAAYSAGQYPTDNNKFSTWTYMYFQSNGDGAGTVSCNKIRVADNVVVNTYSNIYTWDWDLTRGTLQVNCFNSSKTSVAYAYESSINPAADYKYQFTVSADYSSTGYIERNWVNGEANSADISAGYYFDYPKHEVDIVMPERTTSALMTINLNSITNSSYYIDFSLKYHNLRMIPMKLTKTTTDGVASWQITNYSNGDIIVDNLYYDPSRSDNTYQILFSVAPVKSEVPDWNPNITEYTSKFHVEFRYVGSWSKIIGEANYYLKYDYDYLFVSQNGYVEGFSEINLGSFTTSNILRTPLMRMDAETYSGVTYSTIEDQTYKPSDFRTNPATTISDPQQYGTSLTFGGNTYTVTKGNINLSGHDIPVRGLVLSSVPNDLGTYDNKIGNTTVSTTADPSTITFNGQWSASISTQSMESYTYTHTEWNAGSFGWDGVDQNFLMVGLLTCLGVFIALGIYARKRGTGGIIPLMIVTGCAAAVFFIML